MDDEPVFLLLVVSQVELIQNLARTTTTATATATIVHDTVVDHIWNMATIPQTTYLPFVRPSQSPDKKPYNVFLGKPPHHRQIVVFPFLPSSLSPLKPLSAMNHSYSPFTISHAHAHES